MDWTVSPHITRDGDGVTVWGKWSHPTEHLDRPIGHGISCGPNATLAARLGEAISAQKVFAFQEVKADIYGKTYVVATCNVRGRTLNADLKALGF